MDFVMFEDFTSFFFFVCLFVFVGYCWHQVSNSTSAGRVVGVGGASNGSGMSSSALSRHWGPERSVPITRDPTQSLGISIVGGKVPNWWMKPPWKTLTFHPRRPSFLFAGRRSQWKWWLHNRNIHQKCAGEQSGRKDRPIESKFYTIFHPLNYSCYSVVLLFWRFKSTWLNH